MQIAVRHQRHGVRRRVESRIAILILFLQLPDESLKRKGKRARVNDVNDKIVKT